MGIRRGTWCGGLLTAGCRRSHAEPRRRRRPDPATTEAVLRQTARRCQLEAVQSRRLARVSRMARALDRRLAALEEAASTAGLAVPTPAPPDAALTDMRSILRDAKAACAEPAARLAALALDGADAQEDAILRQLQNYTPEPAQAAPTRRLASGDHAGSASPPPATSRRHCGTTSSERILFSGDGRRRYERVSLEEAFDGVERVDTLDTGRLGSFAGVSAGSASGEAILASLKRCRMTDDDRAHWRGEEAAGLRAIAGGAGLLAVARDVCVSSPVKLFTPPGAKPLTALLTRAVRPGQPLAQYAGELLCEEDEVNSKTGPQTQKR